MTSARRFRDVSASNSARSAATVDRRSSQKAIGIAGQDPREVVGQRRVSIGSAALRTRPCCAAAPAPDRPSRRALYDFDQDGRHPRQISSLDRFKGGGNGQEVVRDGDTDGLVAQIKPDQRAHWREGGRKLGHVVKDHSATPGLLACGADGIKRARFVCEDFHRIVIDRPRLRRVAHDRQRSDQPRPVLRWSTFGCQTVDKPSTMPPIISIRSAGVISAAASISWRKGRVHPNRQLRNGVVYAGKLRDAFDLSENGFNPRSVSRTASQQTVPQPEGEVGPSGLDHHQTDIVARSRVILHPWPRRRETLSPPRARRNRPLPSPATHRSQKCRRQ